MYDLLLRFVGCDKPNRLEFVSFGCGSMIEAWSISYALSRLIEESPGYWQNISYGFRGVDTQEWNMLFLTPNNNPSMLNKTHMFPAGEPESCFNAQVRFYKQSTGSYLKGALWETILSFSKILNCLDKHDVDEIVDNLCKLNFNSGEYYICASHLYKSFEKDANRLDRFIDAINRKNEFNVIDVIGSSSPESMSQTAKIYLGGEKDRLVNIRKDPGKYSLGCYGFESQVLHAEDERKNPDKYDFSNGSSYSSDKIFVSRICNLNGDFGDFDLHRKTDEIAKKIGDHNSISKVSQIVFEIVKLERK